MKTFIIIAILIISIVALLWWNIIKNAKNRKESLTIMEGEDSVKLLISDSNYYEFNIANIKNNKEQIYEEIKKVLESKSKELSRLVNRVKFFKNGDIKQEKELLEIILNAR